MTSHTMAPTSPQSRTQSRHRSAIRSIETRSPPMVCATRVPNIAKATKLKNAAQATATPGESTRVETTVAIELAASCHPFATSKISATRMMSAINASAVVIYFPGALMNPSIHWRISSGARRKTARRNSSSPTPGGGGVIKTLMNAHGIAGEDRAAFFGIITDCDYIIELLADELFNCHRKKKSWPVFELTSQLIVASSEETTRSRFRS